MTHVKVPDDWRYIYAAIVVAAAALFLYSVHAVLSPLFIYLLLVLVLTPYRGTSTHTIVIIAASIALALWLLEALGSMLAPFSLAFVLAYILDPAVDALQRRARMKRGVAVACVVGPALIVLGLALSFGVPALIQQIESLVRGIPDAAVRVSAWLEQVRS